MVTLYLYLNNMKTLMIFLGRGKLIEETRVENQKEIVQIAMELNQNEGRIEGRTLHLQMTIEDLR